MRSVRRSLGAGFGVAAQPNAGKPARHGKRVCGGLALSGNSCLLPRDHSPPIPLWRAGLPALARAAAPSADAGGVSASLWVLGLGLLRNPTRASPLATRSGFAGISAIRQFLPLASGSQPHPYPCGERACPRWAAQRPQCRRRRCVRRSLGAGFGVAAQPNAGKPARHKKRVCGGLALSGNSCLLPRDHSPTHTPVASGLARVGARSGPSADAGGVSASLLVLGLGLLRNPTRASPLATRSGFAGD